MKEIPLTQGKVALIDDADFEWLSQYKWCAKKNRTHWYVVGSSRAHGYNTSKVFMHRLILGTPPEYQTDHIDGNGLNNQRSNLRVCTNSQNSMNRIPHQGTSRFKGVSWYRKTKCWVSHININGKRVHVGYFKSEIEAANAYDKLALDCFGEFANLNIRPAIPSRP